MRVLLTGVRAPVALDLARRFHARGDHVIGADSVACPLGRYSNCLAAYVRFPRPAQSERAFVGALQELIAEQKIDLLLPTCEELFYISRHRDSLPCAVLADSLDKLAPLHDKWRFSQSAGNDFASTLR